MICIRSFSSCYVLICGGGREEGRGIKREKEGEDNTITLGVKGGHNSIHSSYAVLFLNQDRPSFHSLFTPYSFFVKCFRDEMNISQNIHNEYLG